MEASIIRQQRPFDAVSKLKQGHCPRHEQGTYRRTAQEAHTHSVRRSPRRFPFTVRIRTKKSYSAPASNTVRRHPPRRQVRQPRCPLIRRGARHRATSLRVRARAHKIRPTFAALSSQTPPSSGRSGQRARVPPCARERRRRRSARQRWRGCTDGWRTQGSVFGVLEGVFLGGGLRGGGGGCGSVGLRRSPWTGLGGRDGWWWYAIMVPELANLFGCRALKELCDRSPTITGAAVRGLAGVLDKVL